MTSPGEGERSEMTEQLRTAIRQELLLLQEAHADTLSEHAEAISLLLERHESRVEKMVSQVSRACIAPPPSCGTPGSHAVARGSRIAAGASRRYEVLSEGDLPAFITPAAQVAGRQSSGCSAPEAGVGSRSLGLQGFRPAPRLPASALAAGEPTVDSLRPASLPSLPDLESGEGTSQVGVESSPPAGSPSSQGRGLSPAAGTNASSAPSATERDRVMSFKEWSAVISSQMSIKIQKIEEGELVRGMSTLSRMLHSTGLKELANRVSPHCSCLFSARRRDGPGRPRKFLQAVAESPSFEVACGLSIVASTVFIGFREDLCVRDALGDRREGGCASFLPGVNAALVYLYMLEVIVRVVGKPSDYFFGPLWKYNILDALVACYSLAEVLVDMGKVVGVRILRVFRLVRVLRLFHAWGWLSDLRLMINSLFDSFGSLMSGILLVLLIQFLFSLAFMNAMVEHVQNETSEEERDRLKEWYGSLGQTMFTLLLAITNGVDWREPLRPLAKIHPLYELVFALYVLFVLVGVLNVLTSTYVERIREISRRDRDLMTQMELANQEAFLTEMRHIFMEVDADKDGKITWENFKTYLESERAQAYFTTQQLDTSDAAGLFSLLKGDKATEEGAVEIEEFALGCMRLRGQARSSDVAQLRHELLRESRKSGRKTSKEFRKVGARLKFLTGEQADMPQMLTTCSEASPGQSRGLSSAGWMSTRSGARTRAQ